MSMSLAGGFGIDLDGLGTHKREIALEYMLGGLCLGRLYGL